MTGSQDNAFNCFLKFPPILYSNFLYFLGGSRINNSLEIESHKLAKEEKVIKDLLDRYEASPDFEGWFPEWLWERRRKNRYDSAICSGDKHLADNILVILMRNLWFNGVIL
jgi:hypothetical protein